MQTHRLRLLTQDKAHAGCTAHPYSQLEPLDHLGYSKEIERWKLLRTETLADASTARADVNLWDLAGFEPHVREAMPLGHQRITVLQWFRGLVYCTAALGEVLIAVVLARARCRPLAPCSRSLR